MTAPVCGADGCDAPAVAQWRRAATESEADAYRAGRLAGAVRVAAYRRARAQIAVVEAQDQIGRLAADPRVGPVAVELLQASLDRWRSEAAQPDPADTGDAGGVVVAVHGCAAHTVPHAVAVAVHDETCRAGACRCEGVTPGGVAR